MQLATLALCLVIPTITVAYEKIICEGQNDNLMCASDQKIMIKRAMFGRKDTRICPHLGNNQVGRRCELDIKGFAVQKCTGQAVCNLLSATSVYGDPCVGKSKYIHVEYECKARSKVCENRGLMLKCPNGGQLVINNSVYGRLETSTCNTGGSTTSNTNCYSKDTNSNIRKLCNNKNSCTFTVGNAMFGLDPCPGTSKYLDTFYSCR